MNEHPHSAPPAGAVTLSIPRPARLLTQLREAIRVRHYSLRTEQVYVGWVRRFVHFHGLRHPRELGAPQVEAFLTHLANERNVSAATQGQAKSALLFLYKQVLGIELPWLDEVVSAKAWRRLPVVLTQREVRELLLNLILPLRAQLEQAREWHRKDTAAGQAGVWLPDALAVKYPKAAQSWGWQWVCPNPTLSLDPRSGIQRRHHLHEQSLQRAVAGAAC